VVQGSRRVCKSLKNLRVQDCQTVTAEVNIPGGGRLSEQVAISLSTEENRAFQGRRLVVESGRRPALEVGGDFFRIIS
jgi:hypothetical protein